MSSSTLLTIYAVGAGVTLSTLLVGFSVMAHREDMGLEVKSEYSWSDFWATVAATILWPMLFPMVLIAGIHTLVIGPIVRRVCAAELMAKNLKKAP